MGQEESIAFEEIAQYEDAPSNIQVNRRGSLP
jgi:hypothetical protein